MTGLGYGPRGEGLRFSSRLLVLLTLVLVVAACSSGDADDEPAAGEEASPTVESDTGAATEEPATEDSAEADTADSSGLFESEYESIVAAAAEEPPVQWCTGMDEFEYGPVIEAYTQEFPDVPPPEPFECFGEEATVRTLAEWDADRVGFVDVIDLDSEILADIDQNDRTHVQDWSVFEGSPVEITNPDTMEFDGRVVNVGHATYTIAYNAESESPETVPHSYEECTNPEYAGRLAFDVRPRMFEMMEEIGGPWTDEELREWAEGIPEQDPLWVRGTSHSMQVLTAEERTIHCPLQAHGQYSGNPDTDAGGENATVDYVIPEQVEVRHYLRLGIAPEPGAPNGTILFVAWMGSDTGGQVALGEANPGLSSPYIEGSHMWERFEQTAEDLGYEPEIYQATQEEISQVSERQNEIVLEAWGFPTPAGD